ncbi:hypothetical protein JKP88DRAFT_270964 [Tribonema minus]|uniref:Cytochrome b5 heme-binding domain-containing protein n=1 Tax=Tribonema minus TaxID=303371 RepID=A0A835YL09_9STRA|nr:hypothetical protein JKP88DRAFT_270964 [Tribonema minus]
MNAGYFGIGLGNRMISADIFAFCDFSQLSATNQQPSCTDRNGIANDLPPQDTSMQGHNDITLKTADLDAATNTWTVVLQRPLSADDATIDQSITNTDTNMIWSYNPDAVAQHSFDHRGINTVNFYSGTNSVQMTSQQSFFALHGLVMLFAWGLFGPMALYVARYKKVHEILASFAVEASVPIAIGAFASAGWVFKSAHGKIGAALFCLIIVQFGSGVLRRMGIQNRGNKYFGTNYDKLHQFNKVYHRVSGRFTVCLGVANVMIGLHIISPMDSVLQLSGLDTAGSDQLNISVSGFNYISLYVFPAWICIMLIAFGAAEVALWAGRKKARKKMIRQLNLPTYTMEEFNDRVLQGEKWLIVNDAVVNVEEYQKVHPGGSKVMKESIGLDVTKEILGLRGVEQGIVNGGHKHR